jgi:2-iminoacetate synthase
MAIQAHPPLSSLAEWIRATDEHAPDRLQLVEQVESALSDPQSALPDDRLRLAQRLERWRYQYLARRAGELTPDDRRLVDALDLAANQLAGRDPRPPRAARATIENALGHDATEVEVMQCLDPTTDLTAIETRAEAITRERFGVPPARVSSSPPRWRMLLYAPLYLSNYCINHCVYCGFRHPNPVERKHLSVRQAVREAEILMDRGFRHILLVAGDFPHLTTTAYYSEILRELKARGVVPAIEISPQSTAAYAALIEAGACSLTLFQETYNEKLYAVYHPRGSKVSFDWRLEGYERAAEAGIPRIGLGILLGLADPREDLIAMVRHARYLKARFPDRTLAFSLPRIHDAPAGFRGAFSVDDEVFLRMYCALRIAFPDAELVLSTREPAALRNRLAAICITQISAGSSTAPGGYEQAEGEVRAGEQFAVCDHRSPAEVASWLHDAGFEPAWLLME